MHFSGLHNGTHFNRRLQRDYNKYGKAAFYFEVLEEGLSTDEVDKREQYWIEQFDSYRTGYNLTLGGEVVPDHSRPVIWESVTYPSITDASLALGISDTTLGYWIRKGYAHFSDVRTVGMHTRKPCVWNGVAYKSLREAAADNGIRESLLRYYLKKGYQNKSEVRKQSKPKRSLSPAG